MLTPDIPSARGETSLLTIALNEARVIDQVVDDAGAVTLLGTAPSNLVGFSG